MKKKRGAPKSQGKTTPQEETWELMEQHSIALDVFGKLPTPEGVEVEDSLGSAGRGFLGEMEFEHDSSYADGEQDSLGDRIKGLFRKKNGSQD